MSLFLSQTYELNNRTDWAPTFVSNQFKWKTTSVALQSYTLLGKVLGVKSKDKFRPGVFRVVKCGL